MKIQTDDVQEAELTDAFLVYTTGHVYGGSRDVAYVSRHRVTLNRSKTPVIGAGVALQTAALKDALRELSRVQGQSEIVWADDFTVAAGPSLNVWWSAAQSRWMHFNTPGLVQSLPAKNPPLVWLANEKGLMVFALKENQRPGPDTALFHAPLFNVYASGDVCMGTMTVPALAEARKWEESFYAATSTHPNPPNRRLTTAKGGNVALWKRLMLSKCAPEFPVKDLIPVGKTLKEVIQKMEGTQN